MKASRSPDRKSRRITRSVKAADGNPNAERNELAATDRVVPLTTRRASLAHRPLKFCAASDGDVAAYASVSVPDSPPAAMACAGVTMRVQRWLGLMGTLSKGSSTAG